MALHNNIKRIGLVRTLFLSWLTAVAGVSEDGQNLAFRKPASQSSTFEAYALPANKAVDGMVESDFDCSMTSKLSGWHWLMVDLLDVYLIGSIRITNSIDCCDERLQDFTIEVSEEDPRQLRGFPSKTASPVCLYRLEPLPTPTFTLPCDRPVMGRYVRLLVSFSKLPDSLVICEFEVFGPAAPATLIVEESTTQDGAIKVNMTTTQDGTITVNMTTTQDNTMTVNMTTTQDNTMTLNMTQKRVLGATEVTSTATTTMAMAEQRNRKTSTEKVETSQEPQEESLVERWLKWREWTGEIANGQTDLDLQVKCTIDS